MLACFEKGLLQFCFVLQIEILRSYYLANLVKTDSGFQWKVNLEAVENNLSELLSFPTEFPHQQFNGRALFIGGGESDYIWSVKRRVSNGHKNC